MPCVFNFSQEDIGLIIQTFFCCKPIDAYDLLVYWEPYSWAWKGNDFVHLIYFYCQNALYLSYWVLLIILMLTEIVFLSCFNLPSDWLSYSRKEKCVSVFQHVHIYKGCCSCESYLNHHNTRNSSQSQRVSVLKKPFSEYITFPDKEQSTEIGQKVNTS